MVAHQMPWSVCLGMFSGKKFFGRSHIREVALKRMTPIAEYCRVSGFYLYML